MPRRRCMAWPPANNLTAIHPAPQVTAHHGCKTAKAHLGEHATLQTIYAATLVQNPCQTTKTIHNLILASMQPKQYVIPSVQSRARRGEKQMQQFILTSIQCRKQYAHLGSKPCQADKQTQQLILASMAQADKQTPKLSLDEHGLATSGRPRAYFYSQS